ncbi:MAG: HD domain-containing protein [Desulfosarcinaceae bacterium]|nr:HD domain-containing protein [Desulfosarcinaceae bacterium]
MLDSGQPQMGSEDVAAREAHLVEQIARQAEALFAAARGSHDWEHSLRVRRLSARIGRVEGADLTVVALAACLHDIGRCDEEGSSGGHCHAQRGAQMAVPLLANLPLEASRRDNILHCIRTHRYRGADVPVSLEAKVLFDADKLDAIGAIGVARAYLFAGELGAKLHNPDLDPTAAAAYSKEDTGYREYCVKLVKIQARMLTAEGRRLAADRHAFMVAFFNRFLLEYRGER